MLYIRTEEHTMQNNKKGFTLIEMLAVIAIIAVLVSIIIPAISTSTDKAKAAADAANLRATLGALNSEVMLNNDLAEDYIAAMAPAESEYKPGAELYVVYTVPGIIDVYYVDEDGYYGLDYLADIAANGSTTLSPEAPDLGTGETWYKVGVGFANPPA